MQQIEKEDFWSQWYSMQPQKTTKLCWPANSAQEAQVLHCWIWRQWWTSITGRSRDQSQLTKMAKSSH
jgi:hypothetical protein